MKTIDFSILSGFPASSSMFKFQQEQMQQLEKLSLLGGNLFILSGCTNSGGVISDGFVCINGVVYPFVGGTATTKVIVTETVTNKNFFGGANNPFYRVPVAQFGVTGNPLTEYTWADFKRNDPANGVLARLEKVEQMLKPLMGYTVDISGTPTVVHGSWLFWGRPEAEIPTGWAEVTDVDWRGRFPLLKDPSNVNYNEVGQLFGEANVTLTPANFNHRHSGGMGNGGAGNYYPDNVDNTLNARGSTYNTDYVVGGESGTEGGNISTPTPHNNMPPARVVIFIKYVG
jgi:hypothetical protein